MPERSAGDAHPAVRRVERNAETQRHSAEARLAEHRVSAASVTRALEAMSTSARLTLNFHPDRRDSDGRTVAAGLLADGRYRTQFETGISNGGRFAVLDGPRVHWESMLFGDSYDTESMDRPIYGALDLFNDSYGGAPRFGSCALVLAPHCFERTTFCFGDSHLGPTDLGTVEFLTPVLAGAVEHCSLGKGFGRGLGVNSFLDALSHGRDDEHSARELDNYIEAQIHGGIDLNRDVASVLLDPSFGDSEVARDIREAARRYSFEVTWNEGSELDPSDVDPDFRGPEIRELAHGTTRPDGLLDAAAIGMALDNLPFTPPSASGDPEDSPRQQYKKLWHCCIRFGKPTLTTGTDEPVGVKTADRADGLVLDSRHDAHGQESNS